MTLQPGDYVLTALVLGVIGCICFLAAGITAFTTKLRAASRSTDAGNSRVVLLDRDGHVVDSADVGIKTRATTVSVQLTHDRTAVLTGFGPMAAIELRGARGQCYLRVDFTTYLGPEDIITLHPSW